MCFFSPSRVRVPHIIFPFSLYTIINYGNHKQGRGERGSIVSLELAVAAATTDGPLSSYLCAVYNIILLLLLLSTKTTGCTKFYDAILS